MKKKSLFVVAAMLCLLVLTGCPQETPVDEDPWYSYTSAHADRVDAEGNPDRGSYEYNLLFRPDGGGKNIDIRFTKYVNPEIQPSVQYKASFGYSNNTVLDEHYFDKAYFVNSDEDQNVSGALVCNRLIVVAGTQINMELPSNITVTSLNPVEGEQHVLLKGLFPWNNTQPAEEWVLKFVSAENPERNVELTIPVNYVQEIKNWLSMVENAGVEGLHQ